MCVFCGGGAFLNEGFKEQSDAGLARERKTHKPQNQKSFCEERKGGAQAMKSERRLLKLLAPCALAHNERLSAARWVGSQARRRSAYKRAPPFKKHEATSKSSESAFKSASAFGMGVYYDTPP